MAMETCGHQFHFSLSIVLNKSFFIPVALIVLSNAPWPCLIVFASLLLIFCEYFYIAIDYYSLLMYM